MLTEQAILRLQSLMDHLETNKNDLVIDGDTHPTDIGDLEGDIRKLYRDMPGYYHGRPISQKELLASMNASGIDMSLIWQNPSAFQYTADKNENFDKLLSANKKIAQFASDYPIKFIPAGWTDPKSLGATGAKRMVDILVGELGFPIVKMNPAQNAYPIDSPDVFEVLDTITSRGATPAFHFGGDSPYTSARGLDRILFRFPNTTIIGVHMGGGGSHYVEGDKTYLEARELGLKRPNLFYILSAKRDAHIESDLIVYTQRGKPFCDNIAWGSDAPYGVQSWNLGGFTKLFETLTKRQHQISTYENNSVFNSQTRQNYLGRNLANVVIAACRNVLSRAAKPEAFNRSRNSLL